MKWKPVPWKKTRRVYDGHVWRWGLRWQQFRRLLGREHYPRDFIYWTVRVTEVDGTEHILHYGSDVTHLTAKERRDAWRHAYAQAQAIVIYGCRTTKTLDVERIISPTVIRHVEVEIKKCWAGEKGCK